MKNINYILLLAVSAMLWSCNNDVPTADDHFLNYEIPDVAPEFDYTVGAHYGGFTWNSRMKEVPVLGNYTFNDPAVYEQHVKWAKQGGIDFFIMNLRSAYVPNQFTQDSTYLAGLQEVENAAELNFALAYNYAAMGLSNENRIENSVAGVDAMVEDFKKMTVFFDKENYQKVGNKFVVYIRQAQDLHAHDNQAVFAKIREEMANYGEGYELYLIAEQWQWTPPMRYAFRFKNGVDAVSHVSYALVDQASYDRYVMFHQYTDQALVYSRDVLSENDLDYVPQFSPSFTGKILNSAAKTYDWPKDEQWFITNCNIAKRSASATRMVILDSFNNWSLDKQVEPAQSYGDDYLKILRSQFKVN
ncbi:hypothetical protein [Persicobacter psychrovividus]|uniref:Uncharacterized protein n=1 Tax=Persicobacter psychrovividus TaxID=387638 RepID=A0ABM7VCS6_9BACT|nr:hypothetical protein PEPS_10280 [Persicobacter psychrovividus]